jgi:hypothetical protein
VIPRKPENSRGVRKGNLACRFREMEIPLRSDWICLMMNETRKTHYMLFIFVIAHL